VPDLKVAGVAGVQRRLDALAKEYSQAVVTAAYSAGLLVEGEAKKLIQRSSPGGKLVIRYQPQTGTPYTHTASEPGEAPNTDTGALARSVSVEIKPKTFFSGGGVIVGSTLEYAKWLEFGTKHMAARPWLTPALEAKRDEIFRIFKIEVGKIKGDKR
jgi:HK97 gp10 family phage protein